MAERWQQWMPFHIDRFRGSPDVQAMHPAARCGFLYLLASAWQTEDCSLSADPIDLATASGLGDELWAIHGPRILRKFSDAGSGRIVNHVLTDEWNIAHHKFLTNQKRAEVTNEKRRASAGRTSDVGESNVERTHLQEQEYIQEQKQVPSRGKREGKEPDPRHVPCRLAVETYCTHAKVLFVWDQSAAKQLDLLLKATPALTVEVFQNCLRHRLRSHGLPHGDHPRTWLPSLLKYQQGPLNEYGKTEDANAQNRGNQPQRVSAAQQRVNESDESLRNIARRRYGVHSADETDQGSVREQAGDTGGDSGDVPGGVGGAGDAVRAEDFQGRVIEGDPRN